MAMKAPHTHTWNCDMLNDENVLWERFWFKWFGSEAYKSPANCG